MLSLTTMNGKRRRSVDEECAQEQNRQDTRWRNTLKYWITSHPNAYCNLKTYFPRELSELIIEYADDWMADFTGLISQKRKFIFKNAQVEGLFKAPRHKWIKNPGVIWTFMDPCGGSGGDKPLSRFAIVSMTLTQAGEYVVSASLFFSFPPPVYVSGLRAVRGLGPDRKSASFNTTVSLGIASWRTSS